MIRQTGTYSSDRYKTTTFIGVKQAHDCFTFRKFTGVQSYYHNNHRNSKLIVNRAQTSLKFKKSSNNKLTGVRSAGPFSKCFLVSQLRCGVIYL